MRKEFDYGVDENEFTSPSQDVMEEAYSDVFGHYPGQQLQTETVSPEWTSADYYCPDPVCMVGNRKNILTRGAPPPVQTGGIGKILIGVIVIVVVAMAVAYILSKT